MTYIANERPRAARKLAAEVRAAVKPLSKLPNLGNVVREFADDRIRELVVKPFRVVYRVERNGVVIIAIVHGHRLMKGAIDWNDPSTR